MSDESDDGSARRKSGGNYRERITTPEAVLFQDFQNPWNFYFLLMCDDQTISDWMIANGLLAASIPCDKPRCQGELFRKKRGDRQGGFTLRCNENRNHERPMRYNSFFEKAKLCVQNLMVFMKTYLDGNTLLQASRFAGVAYGTTAVNWGSYIRELFKEYFERHTKEVQVQMTGEFEIDESLFGRRCKYHKGPMVYGTCYSPLSKKEDLKAHGFADSKTLTEEKREQIFESICGAGDIIGWMVEILSPTYISNSMLRRSKYNLNTMSHDCAIGLIRKVLERGVNVAEIYVDTVGDPGKYQQKLKELFPQIDITVAKKADADYQIVGAASICAKVARDTAVKNWKFIEDLDVEKEYGSGYPADPHTKEFMSTSLDKVFGFPQFVRFGWSTAAKIIEKNGVLFKWEDDEDEEENTKHTQSLFSFMNKKNEKSQRHKFFLERGLSCVTDF